MSGNDDSPSFEELSQEITAARRQFHDEVFTRAHHAAVDLLTLVPELEAVAIVPTWHVRQDRLPAGLLVGRREALESPAEVVHMAQALHEVLREVTERAFAVLRQADRRMREMSEEIRDKQRQLDELDARLAAGRPEDPPRAGRPPQAGD